MTLSDDPRAINLELGCLRTSTKVLTNIDIQSLKLVERLELEIRPSMNVITGETGAGKSILLGALGLALGDRADSSLILNKNKTK